MEKSMTAFVHVEEEKFFATLNIAGENIVTTVGQSSVGNVLKMLKKYFPDFKPIILWNMTVRDGATDDRLKRTKEKGNGFIKPTNIGYHFFLISDEGVKIQSVETWANLKDLKHHLGYYHKGFKIIDCSEPISDSDAAEVLKIALEFLS